MREKRREEDGGGDDDDEQHIFLFSCLSFSSKD